MQNRQRTPRACISRWIHAGLLVLLGRERAAVLPKKAERCRDVPPDEKTAESLQKKEIAGFHSTPGCGKIEKKNRQIDD